MTQSQVRIGWRAYVGTTTIAALLETYPGAAAAYSLRRLVPGATASIRVRRSSDNEETDIGFTSAGDLNTTALVAFAGSFNGIGYSEDIDNAYWTKYNTTITTNSDLAPDGTMTADMMTETTTSAPHGIYRYISSFGLLGAGYDYPWLTTATFSWNMSFYVKKANGNTLTTGQNIIMLCQDLGLSDGGSKATFDLDYGVATLGTTTYAGQLGAIGATMSDEGNGWWRCSMWGSANSYSFSRQIPTSIVRTNNRNTSNLNAATISGNTGAKYLIWGLQYKQEAGISGTIIEPYTKTTNGGCGAYAHIARWYDQSGNGRHVSQTIGLRQPNIVKLKQVAMNGGKPTLKFFNNAYDIMYAQHLATSTMTSLTGTFSLFTVSKFDNTGNAVAVGGNTNTNNWLNAIINGKFANYVNGYVYGDNPNTDRNLNYLYKSGSTTTLGRNGGNNFTGTNTAMTLTGISIGSGNGANGENKLIGDIQEVVLYNSEKSLATRAAIESNINSYYSIYTPQSSDADAQAFIATAGLTSSTHISALSTLVTSLKASISVGSTQSLWTKMKAIYPFVGGNATSHQFNLKDPRNLDAAYRLGFMGGMTHTSLGAVPNGSNAYAKTFLTPSVTLTSSQHVSFYSMTDRGSTIAPTSNEAELGAMSGGTGIPGIMLALNSRAHNSNNSNHYLARLSGGGYGSYGLTPLTDTRGFALLSRTDLNSVKAFWNGSYYGQTAQSYIALPLALTMFYAHYSNSYSFKTCGFATIGDGLNDAESTALYTIIQAYQTTLGRQV